MSYVALGTLVVSDIAARSQSGDWTGVEGGVFGGGAGGTGGGGSKDAGAGGGVPGGGRDINAELRRIFSDWGGTSRKLLAYDAAAGQNQLGINRQSAQDALALYPSIAAAEREATSWQRGQDVRETKRFGPRLMAHLDKINPGWKEASDSLRTLVQGAGARTPLLNQMNEQALGDGMSPINAALEERALRELALGDRLGADEERNVRQDTRAASSARGLLASPVSEIDEILNLDSARRGRLLQRGQYAQGVQQSLLAELGLDRQFAGQTEELNQRATSTERGFNLAAMQAQQARLAPVLDLISRRTAVSPTAGAAMLASGPNTVGASTALLSALLGYGADVNNTNFNASQAARIAAANNAAAQQAALLNAGGQAIGSFASTYGTGGTSGGGASVPSGGSVPGYTYSAATGYTRAA